MSRDEPDLLDRLIRLLERVGQFGHRIEQVLAPALRGLEIGLLAALFIALVVLGLAQIGLRNFAGTALPWADPAMRSAVLWIAMLAATRAAAELRHIRIDLADRMLGPVAAGWLRRGMLLATSLVCLGMVPASLHILSLEFQFQSNAFLDVPTWVVQLIVPVGFALMAWRFLRHAFGPDTPPAGPPAGPPPEPVSFGQ